MQRAVLQGVLEIANRFLQGPKAVARPGTRHAEGPLLHPAHGRRGRADQGASTELNTNIANLNVLVNA